MLRTFLKKIYFIFILLFYSKYVKLGKKTILGFNRFVFKRGCKLEIGNSSIVEASVYFDKENSCVTIGNRSFIGGSKIICAQNIIIGDDVLISWGCSIVDHNSHSLFFADRKDDVINSLDNKKDWSNVLIKNVIISNKVWIGFDVKILKGVIIGEGAVVAAGSIVTKNVPPYTLVGGIPAKILRDLTNHH